MVSATACDSDRSGVALVVNARLPRKHFQLEVNVDAVVGPLDPAWGSFAQSDLAAVPRLGPQARKCCRHYIGR